MIMEEIEEDKYIEVDNKTIILHTNPSELPRLTPTGKISYAKTRVYTQRYRKEWEQTTDFRGWLTSVPHEPTRAYCKYCKKDLHAHRLSLLKHMCTMKHQRSALMFQNTMARAKNTKLEEGDMDVEYSESEENREEIEELDEDVEYTIEALESEEEISFPEHKYARDISKDVEIKGPVKTIKIEMMNMKRDKLAEAMAHVHGEISEENTEHIQLDMDVASETVETSEFEEITNEEQLDEEGHNLSFVSLNSDVVDSEMNEDEDEQLTEPIEFVDSSLLKGTTLKKVVPLSNTIKIKPNNKTVLLSTGARGVTLAPGKLASGTQFVLSNYKRKAIETKEQNFLPVVKKFKESPSQQEASTSQAKKIVKGTKPATPIVKKPTISTHALDMTKGLPIGGLQVSLYKLLDGRWTFVNECNTSPVGRCNDLINSEKNALSIGRYKLHFDVDKYFSLKSVESLYPFIEIVFDVKNPVLSYHIPVLLSPFGYTTYRGMDR
ncbi:uncharacterized protein LOC122497955 [Leptopilina heterotoma]|uniref:uncharacterized protein LOC122497955 n=1 Tax=Leptopilina heterotoma TaxID=63436 RepID=UPI001CA8DEF1|nr:uncharacterized protein LOC122497955 [Leptopilina heterotoma]